MMWAPKSTNLKWVSENVLGFRGDWLYIYRVTVGTRAILSVHYYVVVITRRGGGERKGEGGRREGGRKRETGWLMCQMVCV